MGKAKESLLRPQLVPLSFEVPAEEPNMAAESSVERAIVRLGIDGVISNHVALAFVVVRL